MGKRKALSSFDYSKVPFVKLDDYSTVNPLCEGRRELLWQIPAAGTVAAAVAVMGLSGMAEAGAFCAYYEIINKPCSWHDWGVMSAENAVATGLGALGAWTVGPFITGIFGGSAAVAPEIVPEVIGAAAAAGDAAIELGEIIIEDAKC